MFDWLWKTVLGGSVELDTLTVVDPDMGVPVSVVVPGIDTSSSNSSASTDQNDDGNAIITEATKQEEEETPPESKKRGCDAEDESPNTPTISADIIIAPPPGPEMTNGMRPADSGAANASIATKASTSSSFKKKKARLGEHVLQQFDTTAPTEATTRDNWKLKATAGRPVGATTIVAAGAKKPSVKSRRSFKPIAAGAEVLAAVPDAAL